jgi:subtilase family protein
MPTRAVAAAQRRLIVDTLDRDGTTVASGPGKGGEPPINYLYRRGHIIVREAYLDRVRTVLPRRPEGEPREAEGREQEGPDVASVIPGVVSYRLPGWDTIEALEQIRDSFGPGVAAPDHLVSITGEAGSCPATEPEPVPVDWSPDPRFRSCGTGEGVRVVVVDNGFDAHSANTNWWLRGVSGDPDLTVGQAPAPGQPRPLGPYAGHGTFIAGVIRSVAPLADVRVRAYFREAGVAWESELVKALDTVLAEESPDIISMSAGTATWNSALPLCFEAFYANRLRHHKGVVLVVAAGNDARRDYFWPAAAPWTVSVGALSENGRNRAHFSNYGGWVDVYAPGEGLINAYPSGRYTYQEPPLDGTGADFDGMARWSGTSFSTPVVAGLIAARMSQTGENGQTAAAALLEQARAAAIPGVGAVLLPG